MIILNLFVAILCGIVAKQSFEHGLTKHGWMCLVLSAINAAFYLDAVI